MKLPMMKRFSKAYWLVLGELAVIVIVALTLAFAAAYGCDLWRW